MFTLRVNRDGDGREASRLSLDKNLPLLSSSETRRGEGRRRRVQKDARQIKIKNKQTIKESVAHKREGAAYTCVVVGGQRAASCAGDLLTL